MKRFIALVLVILCFSSVQAAESAFDRGSKSVSGNFLYSRFGGDIYSDQTVLDFNPQYSVCLNKGFFLGVIGQLRRTTMSDLSYRSTNTQWRIGLLSEWYQPSRYSSPHPMIPYFRLSYLFGRFSQTNAHSLGIQMGVLQMLTKSTGLDFGLHGSFDRYSRSGNSEVGFILMGAVGFKTFIF